MEISLNQSISVNSKEFAEISKKIQGNILKSHGRDHVFHIFVKFDDQKKAKNLIKRYLAPKLTTAFKQHQDSVAFRKNSRRKFKSFLNLSLSKKGYEFLGVEASKIPQDDVFQRGMKDENSISIVNDPAVNDWQKEYQEDWHAVIILANASCNLLNRITRFLKRKLKANGVDKIYIEEGTGIKNEEGHHIEHFGYVDGISQPLLINDDVNDGSISTNNWNPLANLDQALVKDPGSPEDNNFGSYFVFRKLEQNVKAFHEAEEKLAKEIGVTKDYAGAQMVGRFRSGNPLIPVTPPQPQSSGQMNDFNYDDDTPNASKCPFHAHVRKTNPRGNGGFEDKESEAKHLFPRRGITFGPDSTKMKTLPEGGVGLLFMAYNSNIPSQFEFMQRLWANNADFPGNKPNGPHGIDAVIGQGEDQGGQNYFSKWEDDASMQRVKPSIGGFVTMKGGEYFFTPSISFLKSL